MVNTPYNFVGHGQCFVAALSHYFTNIILIASLGWITVEIDIIR